MNISWSKTGGRVVSETWVAGRRGTGALDVGVSFNPKGSKSVWVLPRCRADGIRRSTVRDRDLVANPSRFNLRGSQIGVSPTSRRRLASLEGQKQVVVEGKCKAGSRFEKDLRSFAEVVAAPLVVGSDRRRVDGSSLKEVQGDPHRVSLREATRQDSGKEENAKVLISSSSAVHPQFRFKFRQAGTKDGLLAISFSAAEVNSGVKKFRKSMVLKFHAVRPPAVELKSFILSQWKVKGEFYFTKIWDSSHVIVLLNSEADVRKASNCHVQTVGTCSFKAFRWTAEYDPKKMSKVRRFWVLLPDIPLFLYDKRFVKVIMSSFAKFIHLDEDSEFCWNLNRMRALIEVDEDQVIPDMIWIQLPNLSGFWQKVQVEGNVCLNCCNIHLPDENCAIVVGDGNAVSGGIATGDAFTNGAQSESHIERPVEGADHWHLVSHGKKKRVVVTSEDHAFSSVGHSDNSDGCGVLTEGQLTVAEEVQMRREGCFVSTEGHLNVADEGTISLSPADNRSTNPIKDAHVPIETAHKACCGANKADKESDGTHASSFNKVDKVKGANIKNGVSIVSTKVVGAVVGDKQVTNQQDSTKIPSISSSSTNALGFSSKPNDPMDVGQGTCLEISSYCDMQGHSQNIVVSSCKVDVPGAPNATVTELSSGNSKGRPVSPNGQSKVVPCDSIELLRKKMGRHKLAGAPSEDVAPKLDSYGSTTFPFRRDDHSGVDYFEAKGFYLHLKAKHMVDECIFFIMDKYFARVQAQEECPSSPIGTEEDSVDLSRILKQPRQKSKGSRHSGRSGPKKKDSDHIW